MPLTNCPSCGNEVPPGMPTCGWCGASLAVEPEPETVTVQQADRRVFGVPPATGLLALTTLLIALGVILVFTGNAALGLFALAAGLLVFAGFPSLARRPDESPVARRAVRSYDGLRERADATIESLAARASARRNLSRIDGEIVELESSYASGLGQLGEATYARDDTEIERLRKEVAAADAALDAKRAEREQLLTETEERVEGARLRAQPTERLQAQDDVGTEVKPPEDTQPEGTQAEDTQPEDTQAEDAPAEDDATRRAS